MIVSPIKRNRQAEEEDDDEVLENVIEVLVPFKIKQHLTEELAQGSKSKLYVSYHSFTILDRLSAKHE
jgi:hypothetical protein